MSDILAARFPRLDIRSLIDFPGAPEPEETAITYEGNAIIKAESALAHTGEWCVADDAGLEIDAMAGQLGVHSKRFGGAETTFDQKIQRILDSMSDVAEGARSARFRCWVALSRPGASVETFEGTCQGHIAPRRRGSNGFGYDSIFIPDGHEATMAELTAAQKHEVSHRGKVLLKLSARLAELC